MLHIYRGHYSGTAHRGSQMLTHLTLWAHDNYEAIVPPEAQESHAVRILQHMYIWTLWRKSVFETKPTQSSTPWQTSCTTYSLRNNGHLSLYSSITQSDVGAAGPYPARSSELVYYRHGAQARVKPQAKATRHLDRAELTVQSFRICHRNESNQTVERGHTANAMPTRAYRIETRERTSVGGMPSAL